MSRRKKQRIDEHDAAAQFTRLQDTFRIFCDLECPNSKALCNIILDLCYHKRKTMAFAWNVCSAEIVDNLLERNGGMISYPVEDCNGDVLYGGRAHTFRQKKLEDLSEYRFE